MMGGAQEIKDSPANQLGNEVFQRLVQAGFSQPYPWKLTLVDNQAINASSTAGGQVYVFGGMLKLLENNPGLWAATLSHEVSHTGLRHQVRVYLQALYNQQMIAYYRARARVGDKSANWALLGFTIAAPLALKKMERDQEHVADQTGMMLMARAGYHPDYVFALHHVLRMRTGEHSKFGAFFSDHPRWETRDQRTERAYADAMAEYDRLWPDPNTSPGGSAPSVAFLGQVQENEDRETKLGKIKIPLSCRNTPDPLRLVFVFFKENKPLPFQHEETLACPEKEVASPIILSFANPSGTSERKFDAELFVVGAKGEPLEISKRFKMVFPR
jgi:hypothetical protein